MVLTCIYILYIRKIPRTYEIGRIMANKQLHRNTPIWCPLSTVLLQLNTYSGVSWGIFINFRLCFLNLRLKKAYFQVRKYTYLNIRRYILQVLNFTRIRFRDFWPLSPNLYQRKVSKPQNWEIKYSRNEIPAEFVILFLSNIWSKYDIHTCILHIST